MRQFYLVLLAVLALSCVVCGQRNINRDPLKTQLVTSDITNFWKAYDLALKKDDPKQKAEIFKTHYIDAGSAGVKGFLPKRIRSAEHLVRSLTRYPRFYASIRIPSQKTESMKPAIIKSMVKLKDLYPEAVFPAVYFVIGRINSGGTASNAGLLIGTEMHCRTKDTPLDELTDWHRMVLSPIDNLPHIVAHESIHFQQRVPQKTLLDKAIQEGSADLLAELISGKHINYKQHAYGDKNEQAVWEAFAKEMHGSDFSNWLYNGDKAKTTPPDMAYYVGYKISAAYYRKQPDKKKAIKDILNFKNGKTLLAASGYAEKFKTSGTV